LEMDRSRARDPSQRQLRVGEEIRHALARILARESFHDPALAGINITVTEVRISPDLHNATAFVTPLGGSELTRTVAALNHAAGFIQRHLAQEVTLRRLPRLQFEADRSFDRVGQLRDLMERPRVRRDLAEDAGDRSSQAEEPGHGS